MIIYHLPCKDSVKHFLESNFGVKGNPILLRKSSYVGNYFHALVVDASEKHDKKPNNYRHVVPIKITEDMVLKKGCILTGTNVVAFNTFVHDYFKNQIHVAMDVLIEMKDIKIKEAVDMIYNKFDLDESIMTYEAIRKDYQRYKKGVKRA